MGILDQPVPVNEPAKMQVHCLAMTASNADFCQLRPSTYHFSYYGLRSLDSKPEQTPSEDYFAYPNENASLSLVEEAGRLMDRLSADAFAYRASLGSSHCALD